MHYIRLLRPPSLDKKDNLNLILTITTDLGDSFLSPERPLPISIYATHSDQEGPKGPVKIDDGSIQWRSGSRVLKFDFRLPAQILRDLRTVEDDQNSPRIRIVASRSSSGLPNITEIPFNTKGCILSLSVPLPRPGKEACFTATREFLTPVNDVAEILSIDEEMGESIDRHVWDAGVVTTGLIFDMCKPANGRKWNETPLLRGILRSASSERTLNVIELGCGVGILGIGLATALFPRHQIEALNTGSQKDGDAFDGSGALETPANATPESVEFGSILLTDLPDAEELTRENILRYHEGRGKGGPVVSALEFESLDWVDGQNGVFGPKANATAWDLIIISDCTYNADMLSALVDTLSALHRLSKSLAKVEPKVMLATKPRHSSEKALFDLMAASGWNILESASQPLPSLGLEDESVEIYLFDKVLEQGDDGRSPQSSAAKRRRLA